MRQRLHTVLAGAGVPHGSIDDAAALEEARALLGRDKQYRLVLLDIGLPDGSGLDLVAHLAVNHPQAACVVVSAFGGEDVILAALQAGAAGYLLKESEDLEIALGLRSIARGGAPIDPVIARRILALLTRSDRAPAGPQDEGPSPLTDRETEVLERVSRGMTNREIADAMSLSPLTVESHTKNIYRKLAVGSRTEAVYQARKSGWLE